MSFKINSLKNKLTGIFRSSKPRVPLDESTLLKKLKSDQSSLPGSIQLSGINFHYIDPQSFVGSYCEHFQDKILECSFNKSNPLIIDCGANIGLVSVALKQAYPDARIIAIEPDPDCFQALQANCEHYNNIELVNAAAWINNNSVVFNKISADGGFLSELAKSENSKQIEVPCVRLKDYLNQEIDFLKIDIEGAEIEVLKDCSDMLENVKFLFVEYHSFVGKSQQLGDFLNILERAGFRLHIQSHLSSKRPLKELEIYNNKDLRLNIYASRNFNKKKINRFREEI